MAKHKSKGFGFIGILFILGALSLAFVAISAAGTWLLDVLDKARDRQSQETGDEFGRGIVDGIVDEVRDRIGGSGGSQRTGDDSPPDERSWTEWAADNVGLGEEYDEYVKDMWE